MDYEKKNKDDIRVIKQALRQLAANGVPVGNMIEAIKDIEEKYAESEDEKIRKELINYLYDVHDDDEERARWIAYLEKQGEQKPNKCMYSNDNYTDEERKVLCDSCEEDCEFKQKHVEWSQKDENMLNSLMIITDTFFTRGHQLANTNITEVDILSFLKSLKDRVQPQPNKEWSEEDEWKFTDILALLRGGENYHYNTPDLFTWLKSHRPQPHWKPSEEQMKALRIAKEYPSSDRRVYLDTLYEQLKAL